MFIKFNILQLAKNNKIEIKLSISVPYTYKFKAKKFFFTPTFPFLIIYFLFD